MGKPSVSSEEPNIKLKHSQLWTERGDGNLGMTGMIFGKIKLELSCQNPGTKNIIIHFIVSPKVKLLVQVSQAQSECWRL